MYEIADPSPLPARPDLPGTVVLRPTADEAIDAAAADLFIHAMNCVRTFGDFHLAIAVEAGIEPLLLRLMYDPAHRELPWARVHLWLVDEEVSGGGRRGAAMVELVVLPSGIPESQVHRIDLSDPAPEEQYEAHIREVLGWREKGHDRLDCALFGLDEGSLGSAPRRGVEPEGTSHRLVARVPGTAGNGRVSMTPRFVSAARLVGVVALGARCKAALRAAASRDVGALDPHDPRRVLCASGGPIGGELRWYLDSAACPEAGGLGP